jgi:hypothetical protein
MIGTLMRQVKTIPQEADPVMRLNLVYVVFGELVPKTFDGVAYGRFRRIDRTLLLNAGIDGAGAVEMSVEARREVLVGLMWDAVDEAEAYARKRRIADGLPELRRVAGLLAGMPATDGQEKTSAELDAGTPVDLITDRILREFDERKAREKAARAAARAARPGKA